MGKEFWLDSWEQGNTPFHESEVQADLASLFPRLEQAAQVLVPLCGKSLDMLWLREQGYRVLGVELSAIAIEQFFEEQKVAYQKQGDHYVGEGIELICCDIFTLSLEREVDVIYDRAALIALPEKLRPVYVQCLKQYLKPGGGVYLKTIAYECPDFEAPPHSVTFDEVKELYEWANGRQCLRDELINLDESAPLYRRGLRTFQQRIDWITV